MASQKTKFFVGLFVASGICIVLLAIIWLGMSRFLEKGNNYVTYFNESVQGLDKDSPVKYRGVSIGRVERIGVAPDSKLIQVVLIIESGQALSSDIVAQLKPVGITGSMFIELDRKRKGEPDRSPTLSFPSEYPIVASKPSEISEIFQGVDDVLQKIKALDLKGVSDKIKLTLDNISQMIADTDMKGISANLQSSLESANQILDNRRWEDIITSIEETIQGLKPLVDKTDSIITSVEKPVRALNPLIDKADKIMTISENTVHRLESTLFDDG